jgi:AraC-binding-like domain
VATRLKPTDEACAINNYKLILQLHGSAEIRTDTERHELRCGDWSIYDPQKTVQYHQF